MPDEPEIVAIARRFREELNSGVNLQVYEMAQRWLGIENQLSILIDALLLQIEGMRQDGIAYENAVRQMERYQALRIQTKQQVTQFAAEVESTVKSKQLGYAVKGIEDAADLIGSAGGVKVSGFFNRLPVSAAEEMAGMLSTGSPLHDLLMDAWPDSWAGMSQALFTGISLGYGPRDIAKEMVTGLTRGLNRCIVIARTEELRAYRQSSVAQYRHSGIVHKYRRLASKQSRTCMACLMSDGEIFDSKDDFTDHPCGRCTTIPIVDGMPMRSWVGGKQWFYKQDEATQRQMMGNQYYEAWRRGLFKLEDLRSTAHSDKWGDSPSVTPLKKLITQEQKAEVRTFLAAKPKPEIKHTIPGKPEKPITITKRVYKKIEKEEEDIRLLPKEKGLLFDVDGNVILAKGGNVSSIYFSPQEYNKFKGNVFTHNHPGGSTLSPEDVMTAFGTGLVEIRATGKEYTYYLRPTKEAKAKKLIGDYQYSLNEAILKSINEGRETDENWRVITHEAWVYATDRQKVPYGRYPAKGKK